MLSPTKLDTLRGKAGAVLNSTFPFTKETLVNKYSVIFLYQSCNSKLTQFAPKNQRKNILWKMTTIFFFQYYMNAKIFQCYSFWKPRQKKKQKQLQSFRPSATVFHLILRFGEQSCIQQEVRGEVTIKHWACSFFYLSSPEWNHAKENCLTLQRYIQTD